MLVKIIKNSETLTKACDSFLAEIDDWVKQCISEYADAPAIDCHDQGTFTTAWVPYIQQTNNTQALQFMKNLRDKVKQHFTRKGAWKHGYWAIQEAHHGTEHFELFLGDLWRLDPKDNETIRQFIDAAEHMGNWVSGIPEWFNWDTGLFWSMYFGTDDVKLAKGTEMNVPDHFRCINICLLAYKMTGDKRYLELSNKHGKVWVNVIMAEHRIPLGVLPEKPVYEFSTASEKFYRTFVGILPSNMDLAIDRVENILASGGINALLELWQLTGDKRFKKTAEKLLDIVVAQITDPDAEPTFDLIRAYRTVTGDNRYDNEVLNLVASLKPYDFDELSMEPDWQRSTRPSGIGKRNDMPVWRENGQIRAHNPVLISLAAEITNDKLLATRAVDISRIYFQLAREAYGHGREHGCSAKTVSAIARGHGRNNNTGVVTGVLGSLFDRFKI